MDKSVLLDISSTFEMLRLVDQVSEQFGQMAGLDEDGVHCLGVAVREAAINAMKHGNHCDRHKRVRVEYAVPADPARPRVVVRVRDEGNGLDMSRLVDPLAPENISGTSGRGIFLMRTFMDDVSLRPSGEGGMEVRMVKRIQR